MGGNFLSIREGNFSAWTAFVQGGVGEWGVKIVKTLKWRQETKVSFRGSSQNPATRGNTEGTLLAATDETRTCTDSEKSLNRRELREQRSESSGRGENGASGRRRRRVLVKNGCAQLHG